MKYVNALLILFCVMIMSIASDDDVCPDGGVYFLHVAKRRDSDSHYVHIDSCLYEADVLVRVNNETVVKKIYWTNYANMNYTNVMENNIINSGVAININKYMMVSIVMICGLLIIF
jgi:hypothetical protein